jgi:hypothetical protein
MRVTIHIDCEKIDDTLDQSSEVKHILDYYSFRISEIGHIPESAVAVTRNGRICSIMRKEHV